jgi:geranylgeranyl diphosphate synthase type I
MELDFHDRQLVTEEAYYQMISLRSGSLTGCSAELGALAGGAGESEYLAFHEMGRLLGMAGQIIRDVEETWGANADGITPSNAINKKKSLPLIHAMETAPVTAKRQLSSIYVKRTLDSEDLSKMIGILDEAGSREFSESKAREMADQAMAALDGFESETRSALEGLAHWALDGPA